MKREKNIFKKILFSFFAFCLAGTGYAVLTPEKNLTQAENTIAVEVSNAIMPNYFDIQDTLGGEKTDSSLISSNIFSYYTELSKEKKLTLSFITGSSGSEGIYSYVYYPNTSDTKNFKFFLINSVTVTVNGVALTTTTSDFVTDGKVYFKGSPNSPQKFEMVFAKETASQNNVISIADSNGNIVEGVYTVSITYTEVSCTDGKSDQTESEFTDQACELEYSFYVIDQNEHYLYNNRPIITSSNFDSTIELSTKESSSFKLYSNFSAKGNENKIPSITYDYERYDISILKSFSNATYVEKLLYDCDNKTIVSTGEKIISYKTDETNHTCTVYFYDVGDYSFSFNDILLVTTTNTAESGETTITTKHSLTGLTAITRNAQVYIYGYQALYTDMDGAPDENNIRPTKELKTKDFETGEFEKSADITSGFLNSNIDYSQEIENDKISNIFTISNIVNYINNGGLTPVKTNQTPIKFTSNATLSKIRTSSIYSLTQISPAYTDSGAYFNENKLYRTDFTGKAESSTGTYIYIIAYTFDKYYSSENVLTGDKLFYQVFYFEISKEVPSITVMANNEVVYADKFVNNDVVVADTTKDDPYNKSVSVRIYAKDFNGNYISDFGGTNGIAIENISGYDSSSKSATLTESAHYTIRMFFSNEIGNDTSKLNISTNGALFREQRFTIDKEEIDKSAIVGTNVSENTNSTYYIPVSTMSNFTTNQKIVLSWNEKASGASTYAYYRYFKLKDATFYSADSASLSLLLSSFLSYENESYLPVNAVLDMSTTNNRWLKYAGNAQSSINSNSISSEYVLTNSGLYILDVYDEAGNHAVKVFLIDDTKPLFALKQKQGNGYKYSLTSSSEYISQYSELFWSQYKCIYIKNFSSTEFANNYVKSEPQDLTSGLYTTYGGISNSLDIFNALHEILNPTKYAKNLEINKSPKDDVSILDGDTYTGVYLTIPIDSTSYYLDKDTNNDYSVQTDVYTKTFDLSSDQTEMTYRVLIRDLSNTKYLAQFDKNSVRQYKEYGSASQTIIISFDTSEFRIEYTNDNNETIYLSSNNMSKEETETNKYKLTTYLSPTNLETLFSVSFVPTKDNIQIQKVEAVYYEYITDTRGDYHYSTISKIGSTIPIYEYNDSNGLTSTQKVELKKNLDGVTCAGKYVITRTYTEGTSLSQGDSFERTFVFYVDRNGVISAPETVTNSDGITSHIDNAVGGDIFVSMYDNGACITSEDGTKIDTLVITYPDSANGNINGTTLYNNGNVTSALTTNKFPVKVYVPQRKYTTYVEKVYNTKTKTYKYVVHYDFENDKDTMNMYENSTTIAEYSLFAEIYRASDNNVESTLNAILANSSALTTYATTATNSSGTLDSVSVNDDGFLNFWTAGKQLDSITEAGTYFVKITQGLFGTGESSFKQVTIFAFTIEKPMPDFTAQDSTGASLNGKENNSKNASDPTYIYYTNQSTITLTWDKAETNYMADIDINAITFKTNKSSSTFSSVWSKTPELTKTKYVAQINLQNLGGLDIYETGSYVDITMQYVNHNDNYYQKVTKRIYVDLCAPTENIKSLVENSQKSKLITPLTYNALRVGYTQASKVTTEENKTCYNVSVSTGEFAYYSYTVNSSYLSTLKSSVEYKTYIKKFEDNKKYTSGETQETAPKDFNANLFNDISTQNSLDSGAYYEIVETDWAGNMTIYTIYVVDYDSDCNLITYSTGSTENYYTTADYKNAENATATKNIYSKTIFTLDDINYFGDAWAQIKLTTYNVNGGQTTKNLILDPWNKGYAYSYSKGVLTKVALSDLIDGTASSNYKNEISIFNREKGIMDCFYVNIKNTSLKSSLTNVQSQEYITFQQPTDTTLNGTLKASTFVVKMKINAGNNTIFEGENKLGLSTIWTNLSSQNVDITTDSSTNVLKFEIKQNLNLSSNTKIVYEFVDNYGTTYKEIHLYREAIITQEISSGYDLYAYYQSDGQLYYITQNDFKYQYNPNKYSVKICEVQDAVELESLNSANAEMTQNASTGITTLTLSTTSDLLTYNKIFAIKVYDLDDDTNLIKTIYVNLYNELPITNETTENNLSGEFKFLDASRNNITSTIVNNTGSSSGYFSEIILMYATKDTKIPIKYSFSSDKLTWTEVTSGTTFKNTTDQNSTFYLKVWYDEAYLTNELQNSQYVFGIVPSEHIYAFNLTSLTSTYWIEKTINGMTTLVTQNGTIYKGYNDTTGYDGSQYSNHYLVNISYENREGHISIKTNEEQKIVAKWIKNYTCGNVITEIYEISNTGQTLGNIPSFSTKIAITYIPASENFVEEVYTFDLNGILNTSENLVNLSTKTLVVPEDYTTLDKIEFQWKKYYGLSENEINISVIKDGMEITPTVYTRKTGEKYYNYIYITNSGKYTISLKDSSGNIQKFNYGNAGQTDKFTLVFLKDVPFTVKYTPADSTEEQTTIPIKQAVYNNSVTLLIDQTTLSTYYALGGYPTLTATRNGKLLTNSDYTENSGAYTFTTPGYYEIYFTATSSLSGVGIIRQEKYQFTIINSNENKYSYIYNKYSNYYIENVYKNGVDITDNLLKLLDVSTITVNSKTYITELPLSYLDEKTGVGTYTIVVNSNNSTFANTDSYNTRFVYSLNIKVGSAPIEVSVSEGTETSKAISVTFNSANMYQQLGECVVRIIQYDGGTLYSLNINEASTSQVTTSIPSLAEGTFFVQIVSPSGNLLYSYKVVKTEPMNAATIILIIAGTILAVVIIFLIIKLRKRIAVK